MTKTSYIDRVKKGQELYSQLEELNDGDSLVISYNNNKYEINCHKFNSGKSFAIGKYGEIFGNRMNIDMEKSGKSYLFCYTYDLFGKETNKKLYFENVDIIEIERKKEN